VSARLFAVGVEGPSLTDAERKILSSRPPWGVILFARNIESAEQLTRLVADLRECGVARLLLDQEGGPVDRLRGLLGPSPSFRRVAGAGRAREAGELAGAALAHFGFDVDLAPVVDRAVAGAGALVLGERCASADAGDVVRAGDLFVSGLHSRGIGACLKHFPGLGRAALDTHRELPVVPADPHQDAIDLVPFDALMPRTQAVMVSHAAGPDGIPSSLSYARSTALLREVLDFGGVAFSDDLEMGALSAYGGLPARAAAAASAGCDLLLVSRQLDAYPACVEAVEESVPVPRRAQAAERLDEYDRHLAEIRSAAAPAEGLAALGERLRTLVGSLD
jgi:beta-N-acetylhexosaminidase